MSLKGFFSRKDAKAQRKAAKKNLAAFASPLRLCVFAGEKLLLAISLPMKCRDYAPPFPENELRFASLAPKACNNV
ncbi:MAG TPA: hypothetical protein VFS90_23585, partial [Pyrinomonadaceae bacterium]|nr:hypothetical protein [Pyrinomonadaceae bacterium]